jgi:hypothetical protein
MNMDPCNRVCLQRKSPQQTPPSSLKTSTTTTHHHPHHTSPPRITTSTTTTSPPPSLHHYAAKHPHQETSNNTNINLEEDEIQQQNTGSDAGLKLNHNPDHKKVAPCDKEKASDTGVNNNQAKKRQEPTNTTQKDPKKI